MDKTILERRLLSPERLEMPETKKDERDFEITGIVMDVQMLATTSSQVTIVTSQKERIILRTNQSKLYWLEKTRMGREVCIKGKHSISGDGLENILSVRNLADERFLKKYADGDLKKYEQAKKAIESVNPAFRENLIRQSATIVRWEAKSDDNRYALASGHNECLAKFAVLNEQYLPEQRIRIDSLFRAYDTASREDKDRIDRRTDFLVNYVPGSSTATLGVNVNDVKEKMNEAFPGQNGIKNGLLKCLENYQQTPNHMAPRILVRAPKKYDTQRLILTFLDAAKLMHTDFCCAGISDSANLSGSSSIYSNCTCGAFADALKMNGAGSMFFTDLDMATKPEALMGIRNIIDGRYVNDLLDAPLDVSTEWVVMTCTDTEKVPFDVSSGVILLEAEEYKEREMIEQADCMIAEFLRERNLSKDKILVSPVVKRELALRYSGRSDCRELRDNVNDLLQNALWQNVGREGQIKIGESAVMRYFPLFKEAKHLREDKLNSISEIRKKLMLYYEQLPKGIRERARQNLEDLEVTKDPEKRKALIRKTLELGNVRLQEPVKFDFEKIREAFDQVYALDEVKEKIYDYLFSVFGEKDFRFTPIILHGPAGVGKTTIAIAIAESLGIPCIHYAFNQISDPRSITGYSDQLKTVKGLLGRLLEKETDCAVVFIDELDKPLVKGMYEALHNVLDTQEVKDQEYDCSFSTDRILFIATCNDLSAIPYTIRNRCEIIKVEPYSINERLEMAKRFVIPKAIKKLGIKDEVIFPDDLLHYLLMRYTLTGGVRETEVAIDNVLRRMKRTQKEFVVTKRLLEESLGVPHANEEGDVAANVCGVAKALAVTGSGGLLFHVTTCRNPYGPELEITGLAKNSFLESIKVALSVASRLTCKRLDNSNLHVHADNAGIEKDGPSAGLCLLASILSLETGIPLGNVAFTGEIEVSGRTVLPIGGIRDKITAAERCSVETVFIPKTNYDRLVAENALQKFALRIIPISCVSDLLANLFPDYHFPGTLDDTGLTAGTDAWNVTA